jgi:hypothetical protein
MLIKLVISFVLSANTESIYQRFKDGSENLNFTAYRKSELPKHWRFGDNRRVPPIVLVSDPAYIFVNSPSEKEEAYFKKPG